MKENWSVNGKDSLKAKFIEIIKSRILSGELKPGDRLSAERSFADELKISRSSINQGILDLERMGFVTIVPRKGTFVAQYSERATAETLSAIMNYDSASVDPILFRDFMDLRILIERECARLACASLTDEGLGALIKNTERISGAGKDSIVDVLYDYHRCITEISGNRAYYMVFQSFEKMIRNLIKEHYRSEDEFRESIPLYTDLTDAIKRRDAYDADMKMNSILGRASDYLSRRLKEEDRR